jgi:hypothetical protein
VFGEARRELKSTVRSGCGTRKGKRLIAEYTKSAEFTETEQKSLEHGKGAGMKASATRRQSRVGRERLRPEGLNYREMLGWPA